MEKNLIVYIVPDKKIVNGGVLSIFSQAKEARQFKHIHKSTVLISVYPGYKSYGRNDLFDNDELVLSFDEIINKWKHPQTLLLHIPETAATLVSRALQEKYKSYLNKIGHVRINIMTQNINLLPSPAVFADLFRITPDITQTTAHDKYTTQEISNLYQTPIHHLSVFIDKSQYRSRPFQQKENLVLYSPDQHPDKEKVLDTIRSLKDFELREIKNLTYSEYKDSISRAKFCITFGEGFDGYFIESYFSGSIGIAVYNEKFFPQNEFLKLPSVFGNYDEMKTEVHKTIKKLNDESSYTKCITAGTSLIKQYYDRSKYLKKMENYYLGKYDFTPQPGTLSLMIARISEEKLKADAEFSQYKDTTSHTITQLKNALSAEQAKTKELRSNLYYIMHSRSWRITSPLRRLARLFLRT